MRTVAAPRRRQDVKGLARWTPLNAIRLPSLAQDNYHKKLMSTVKVLACWTPQHNPPIPSVAQDNYKKTLLFMINLALTLTVALAVLGPL